MTPASAPHAPACLAPSGPVADADAVPRHASTPPWLLALATSTALAQTTLDGSDPNADSTVLGLAVPPDSRIVVDGQFTQPEGQTRHRPGRLVPETILADGLDRRTR